MEYKDRIKAARRHAQITQAELAKRVGIDQASVSDLERGRSLRSSYNASIARECGVSALWLENGSGSMLQDDDLLTLGNSTSLSNVAMVKQPRKMYSYPVVSWVTAGAWAEAVEPFLMDFPTSTRFRTITPRALHFGWT